MNPFRPALVLVSVLVGAGAMLSACSSGGEDPPAARPPAAEATGGVAATTAAPPEDPCGDAAKAVTQHLAGSPVDRVEVVGQCTTVVIATTLSDDDSDAAVSLCDTAAEVAYVADINSIRVESASGDELSNGIKGLKCLP